MVKKVLKKIAAKRPAPISAKPAVSDEVRYKRLRIYNLVMGCFHLAQAIVMVILSNAYSLPVTTSYLKFNIATHSVQSVRENFFNLQIAPLIAAFLFTSALAHFLISTVLYRWYVKNLKKGANYARWWEYAISSSIMIVVIAMLSGMFDFSSLILIFALNACMILFGLVMELHNQTTAKTNWTSYIFGCFAGLVPWVVIFLHFYAAVSSVDAVPAFVYGIIISLFVFFNCFAINMILQYKKIGPWKNYLFGERMYILLSLVAKSALAWQVFAGTLRPF